MGTESNLAASRLVKKITVHICVVLLIIMQIVPPVAAENLAEDWIVIRPGEGLARLARKHLGGPTYSNSGALERLLALNPQIRDPEKTVPGQVIRISGSSATPLPSPLIANLPAKKKYRGRGPASSIDTADFHAVPAPCPRPSSEGRHSTFGADLGYRFIRLDALDIVNRASGVLISTSWIDLGMRWTQHWSNDWTTFARFTGSRVTFQAPKTKALTSESLTLFGFGAGTRYEGRRLHLEIEISADQKPFMYALTTSQVTVAGVVVPRFKIATDLVLARAHPFEVGVSINGSVEAPAEHTDIETKLGVGYGGGVYLQEIFDASRIKLGMSYNQIRQNTTLTTQTQTNLSIGLQYQFEMGKPKQE